MQMNMPEIMKYFQENPADVCYLEYIFYFISQFSQFDALAVRFKEKMITKTHTFRQKSYKNTFVGSEAVDLLVNDITENHQPVSRQDVTVVGQMLM